MVVAGLAVEVQPLLFEQPKSALQPEKPSEFLQIADHMRKFEPRKSVAAEIEPPEPKRKSRKKEDKNDKNDPPPARGSVLGLR